jgi:xanthine dehydrogenase accessory factor
MNHNTWLSALERLCRSNTPAILITVAQHKGSTPRESGTKMIVTENEIIGSIGGGHLEHKAIEQAHTLLADHSQETQLIAYPLGAALGQCCGGAIQLLFEPINPPAMQIAVFGAGHVAKALIPILGGLSGQVHWIDEREALFPEQVPDNVTRVITDDQTEVIETLPADCYVLIMTHNHALDQQLVEAWLRSGKASYLGMIGSATKKRKFEHRLRHKGFDEAHIAQLHCPIGHPDVGGKRPMEIAVSVSAELIRYYQSRETANPESSIDATAKGAIAYINQN